MTGPGESKQKKRGWTETCQGGRLAGEVSSVVLVLLDLLAMMALEEVQPGTEPEVEGQDCTSAWPSGPRLAALIDHSVNSKFKQPEFTSTSTGITCLLRVSSHEMYSSHSSHGVTLGSTLRVSP